MNWICLVLNLWYNLRENFFITLGKCWEEWCENWDWWSHVTMTGFVRISKSSEIFHDLKRKGKNGFLKYLIANASTLKVLETSDVEWMTCESDSWLQVTFVQVVIFLKFSFLLWEWNLFFSNLFLLLQKIAASILKPEYSDNLLFPQFIPWNVTGNFFSHNPDK